MCMGRDDHDQIARMYSLTSAFMERIWPTGHFRALCIKLQYKLIL